MNAQPKPTAGLFLDVPAADYHVRRLGEVSNSGIKRLLRSPAHYRAWIEEPADEQRDTPALAFGRAFHCALLEPERFAAEYAVAPSFGDLRTKAGKEARDAWLAVNAGRTMLAADDAARIDAMLAAVRAHPLASRAIRDGHAEATLRWSEPDGIECKARADYFVPGRLPFVLDVKTCEDASPTEFAKAIARYGYHVQHAHYCEGFRAIGQPLSNYLLLAVEHSAPYAVALYHIDGPAEQRGYALRQRAIDALAACLKSGHWPAYANAITPLSLPGWALVD